MTACARGPCEDTPSVSGFSETRCPGGFQLSLPGPSGTLHPHSTFIVSAFRLPCCPQAHTRLRARAPAQTARLVPAHMRGLTPTAKPRPREANRVPRSCDLHRVLSQASFG